MVMIAIWGAAGCGSVSSLQDAAPPVVDAAPIDGGPAMATCDPLAPFGAPVALAGLEGSGLDKLAPRISADELDVYFGGKLTGGTDFDLYTAHRTGLDQPFAVPVILAGASSSNDDFDPAVSPDGKSLWFSTSNRLTVATRSALDGEFTSPEIAAVQGPSTGALDAQPFITADDSELWFTSSRDPNLGDLDVWHAARAGAGFAAPVVEAALSSSVADYFPTLTPDRRTIYVSSRRTGTGVQGGFDVWRSHRNSVDQPFPAPVTVDELNTANDDFVAGLSADGCRIYGVSNSATTNFVFVATRRP
jgi:hypothetical protein